MSWRAPAPATRLYVQEREAPTLKTGPKVVLDIGSTLIDPKLGVLMNTGGTTPTHALLMGSPAIDKGQCGAPTTDQRGKLRPFDNPTIGNAVGGDGCDIGAFEFIYYLVHLPLVIR
jgi:hypothetical protein